MPAGAPDRDPLLVVGAQNGRAVGRYWEIGPQHSLYVPEPWLQARNKLVILDEEGKRPDAVYLMRDARVAVASVLA